MEDRIPYQNILNNIPYSPDDIVRLRTKYRDCISSRRVEDRITTMQELLKILKKRDELTEEVVNEIQRNLQPDVQINTPRSFIDHQPRRPVFNALPNDIGDRIFQMISEDIGHKWKELARALRIKEGQIDDLEANYPSISERVLLFLRRHQEACDPRMWRTELVEALSKARRNDLGMKVSYEFDIRCW